jgi:competence protein ComEC
MMTSLSRNSLHDPWRAPLVPIALALTAGLVLDRLVNLPVLPLLLLAVVGLAGWTAAGLKKGHGAALVFLWLGVLGLGAAYHYWHRQATHVNDIGKLATGQAQLVRLRGVLLEQPIYRKPGKPSPLRSFAAHGKSQVLLETTAVRSHDQWRPVSGKVRLVIPMPLPHLRPGDEIELVGQLLAPDGPDNPGQFDYAHLLQDRQIRAILVVKHASQTITPLTVAPIWSPSLALPAVRGWAEQVIAAALPEERRDLARALLLGQQDALEQEQWDRFQRTGVVHVLAISGQHLVVLAGFLALVLRLLQVPQRHAAILVPGLLLSYALLTGWRTPVRRAVFMVGSYYGGFWFRRVLLPANSFALAWLLVCLIDPTTIFYGGCQLSFLASGVLLWSMGFLSARPRDPLEELIDEQRPLWQKMARTVAGKVFALFVASSLVWAAVCPLVAAHFHLVCPAGLLLGVPVLLLTSVALIAGFLMLVFSLILWPVAIFFAWLTSLALSCCQWLVDSAEAWPGSHFYVPDIPAWWLWGFYLLLAAPLFLPALGRHWRWAGAALLLWFCLGLTVPLFRSAPDGLRCTFLAVGHGSCVVLELPDGRTMLYDAGAITGPEVTRKQIAPFLWSRGIRRIDEVFLSHGDLDHFNGLSALLERFAIGQISCTPTFADRNAPGVQFTLKAIAAKGVPVRVLTAGDRLSAGAVQMQVLHPPAAGPEGRENFRSLVLLVRHQDHAILLTGDLEGPGLQQLLALPPLPVDVLMSPHHGSASANTKELAAWAAPHLVISCQGQPRTLAAANNPYKSLGAIYLTTWQEGAVCVRSSAKGLWTETFKTGQRWQVR